MLNYKIFTRTIVGVLLINVLTIFLLCYFLKPNSAIVYVDYVKLFDGFVMTKELKRTGEKEFNVRKTHLDSLFSSLQSQSISQKNKQNLMKQFVHEKEELEQFNQSFAASESLKIWTRIHSYAEDFSKENNYELIIGSENKTPVLYSDESIDVTQKLLMYINKRYEGLK
jgi:outer membrane protein